MGSLILVKPLPITAITADFDSQNAVRRLLTPDPKEVFFNLADGGGGIRVDLGAAVSLDCVFLGYTQGAIGRFHLTYGLQDYNEQDAGGFEIVQVSLPDHDRHLFFRLPVPITARYLFIYSEKQPANVWPAGWYAGVLAVGLAFQSTWGTEWGAGRFIVDTGSAERLFGGGFGIDDGVACGGYQWTFGDLTADETERLYKLVKDRRTTRSILVVEDPDQTDGLNERIHWGLFQKLDAYERLDPTNTKWALQIGDWG